jgi:cellulose synthase/poly-beta-1,6-N-acetylglucosamine synthase-like glycosyltransferase
MYWFSDFKFSDFKFSDFKSLQVTRSVRILTNTLLVLMYNLYDKLQHISHTIHISNDLYKGTTINVPVYNSNLTSHPTCINEKVERHNIDQFSYVTQKFREITIFDDSFTCVKRKKFAPVTILIPAYNEEFVIGAALSSIFEQSVLPEQIVVVDDSSSDRTAEVAKYFDGVTIVRTPKNSGSKGHALNYGLQHVNSKYTVTIDADIILEANAVNKMVELMENRPELSATCTFVLPKNTKTFWEHTRFVEYIFALSFYKSVQQMYDSIVICSGCFAIYKTQDLKSVGGWPTDTVAEDMELTWLLYENGKQIGYNAETFCFAGEPETFRLLSKQLKRWNTGFFQVLKLKGKSIKKIPVLREFVIAGLVDGFVGTIFYGAVIYLAVTHHDPYRYLYYLAVDITLLSIPSFWLAHKIKKVTQLTKSFPIYLLVRSMTSFWFYYSFISVYVVRKSIKKWEKGHK